MSTEEEFFHPILPLHSLQVLQDFLNHYRQAGAKFVSLPWVVEEVYSQATNPHPQTPDRFSLKKPLVASGEQSFCQLASKGKIGNDTLYVGWTPCFRSEETFNELHHHYFIKAEAFRFIPDSQDEDYLNAIISLSQVTFNKELEKRGVKQKTTLVYLPQAEQFDILLNGIELGSYGVRTHPTLSCRYLFATVVAEPRFSYAVFKAMSSQHLI